MEYLTINSKIISPKGDQPLTPAMVTALWEIGAEIDKRGIKADAEDALWLRFPSARLRGSERDDNQWLRHCLDRLTGIRINGTWKGQPWGAVLVAEWHFEQNGSVTRLLIPPAAINALRMPETFAKIEAHAAYKLDGHARRLYAVLADKKHMSRQHHWVFGLDELRGLLDVEDKPAYQRWNNFRQWVLDPAITQINDFGTVTLRMTPEKFGRSVEGVRIDWKWKTLDEARETAKENDRSDIARRKPADAPRDAPPLVIAATAAEHAREGAEVVETAWQPQSEEAKAAVTASLGDHWAELAAKRKAVEEPERLAEAENRQRMREAARKLAMAEALRQDEAAEAGRQAADAERDQARDDS